ncbi:MAG: glycosyltransferase family 39 protein [Pseudonocardiales bacterium]|nr:glycosyltransferase family 39 protein [Pseudonocardiales bacterium]
MWASGWGNPYYSAAVKSMSANFTNFIFGSFDPVGVVTVDKPPMAFWPMVVSAAIFGYHGWSLLLPQVIEGVAAVFLLHRTVRLWAGEHVALLAALIFALTPVTVAINRDTNPDTLMVLLLVAAAYAFTRSVQPGIAPGRATRWLLLAAMFLGLGFVTKMLQAWIVVPAFVLAYLVGSATPVRRRVLDLLGAGGVLLASSMWWVALVSFWPAPKPYIGGSTDGSVLDLVIGYNGLGRILGRETGRALVSGARGGFGGTPGISRLFGAQVGGQISWLLPLSLLILLSVTIAGIRQLRSGTPERRAGWLLWGGWLLLVGLVLSVARGGFHPYYTTEMAPAVAALTAAGVAAMWRRYRRPVGYQWLLFPAAVTLTAGWAWVLVSRELSWHGWLRDAVAAVAVAAVALLVAARVWVSRTARVQVPRKSSLLTSNVIRAAGVLGVVALLLAPGVWSAATAFASSGGAMAQAGPPRSAFGAGRFGPDRRDAPAQLRGRMAGDLTADQRKILTYAVANSGGVPITLAVQGGAMAAEPFLIHSDAALVGLGGFSGQAPAPTIATLAQRVQQGRLRFVLAGDRDMAGRGGRGGVSAARTQWVHQHCAPVDPASYGGAGRVGTLYDCQAR